ncbi:MAG: CHRD domain-containing protein [Acidocella sp. 20-57-95]|nr:MAG: CHRD domain-containing protein [Acidocella sp. 20-57-95]HQT64187.1 CHRD domain-containing protein [Acidocella sp.]
MTVLPLTAAAMLAFGGVAMAKTVSLSGQFVSEGKSTATPSGLVSATLDTSTDMLSYSITYAGLTGPVLAAHFHGPAAAGANAKVLIPIPGPYSSGMTGSVKVTKAEEKILEAGKTYVNLHTKASPAGEARAQMLVTK